MAVGALVGAVFGLAAGAMGYTIFSITVGMMWLAGAMIGGMLEVLMPSMSTPSMNYAIDPINNPMAQLVAIPVAYGKVRVGGNIFYQQFEDDTKQIVYEHIALSEGPIKSCSTAAVMANDYTTADLDTFSKEVFLGTGTQAASTWDPESYKYPWLAYVAVKMEASAKLSGSPVITAIIEGRDIDYPDKDATGLSYIGADATASNGFSHSDKFQLYVGDFDDGGLETRIAGYKGSESTCRCWGGVEGGNYADDCKITFLSDTYAGTTNHAVICFPLFFNVKARYTSSIDVYPDSTAATFYTLNLTGMDRTKIVTDPDGVRVGWEVRHLTVLDEGTDDEEVYFSSGIMIVLIPKTMIPSGGKAKLVIRCPEYSGMREDTVVIQGGLLPYTDAETDDTPTFFLAGLGYNNPAWCVYDLLTNARYGCGIPASWIDVDSFRTVAAQCDAESIQLNYVVDAQKPILDHLQEMLAVCRGWLSFRGLLHIGMDYAVLAPSKTIASKDIIEGSFSYYNSPLDQIPNRVTIEYTDGSDDGDGTWEMVNMSLDDWDDIRARGAFERRVSIRGITGNAQAKAMLNYLWESVRRCRLGFSCQVGLANSDIEVGDVISVTYDLPGWTDKMFRIAKVEDTEDGKITIAGVEYDATVYDTTDDV